MTGAPAKPKHSGERMAAALRIPDLTHAEARVLAMIAFHDGPPFGAIPSAARIGFECGGMGESTVRKHIAAMVRKGYLVAIKRQRTSRYMVNYAAAPPPEMRRPEEPDAPEFQFPDRSVAERSQSPVQNPDRSVTEHPDRSVTERLTARLPSGKPEESRKNEPGSLRSHPRVRTREGRDSIALAFAAWNELAASAGLAAATLPTPAYQQQDRVTLLTARLAECGGLEGWRAALARVAASDRLTGGFDSGWRIDLDWMLKAHRFRQIMEGAWDNREPTGRGSKAEAGAMQILERMAAEEAERKATIDAD